MKKDKLEIYRKEIDSIDKKIMKLLERRFNIVKEIGIYKKENKIEIEDKKREKEIYIKIKAKNSKINKNIKLIYEDIIGLSKKSQK